MARKKKEETKAKPKSKLSGLADLLKGQLGAEAVHVGDQHDLGEPKMFIPPGVPGLVEILDRDERGWPTGRIVEIYGAYATCKTGIGYALAAEVQKAGGSFILFPSEGNVDNWLMDMYGFEKENVLVGDENTVEKVFAGIKIMVENAGEEPLLIMIDSVAGLCTEEELNDPDFNRDRGAQVRAMLISKAMRKLGAIIPRTNVILFLINQVREADSAGHAKKKPQPPGGRAIGFYCSVRIRLEYLGKKNRQKSGKKFVSGIKLKATAEKNRLARPFQDVEFELDFEEGIKAKD